MKLKRKSSPLTPEHRAKIALALKGRIFSEQHRNNLRIATIGFKHSDTSKAKMSVQRKGRPSPRKGCKLSDDQIALLSALHRGKKLTDEHKAKISKTHKERGMADRLRPYCGNNKGVVGVFSHTESTRMKISETMKAKKLAPPRTQIKENHHFWKGGITPENLKIRNSTEYKRWRKSVFERDNYTCQFCGVRGVIIQADHIKPFAYFPELRFELSNGRTLCVPCHKTTDTYAGAVHKTVAVLSTAHMASYTTNQKTPQTPKPWFTWPMGVRCSRPQPIFAFINVASSYKS
jgi:hypothetical protein